MKIKSIVVTIQLLGLVLFSSIYGFGTVKTGMTVYLGKVPALAKTAQAAYNMVPIIDKVDKEFEQVTNEIKESAKAAQSEMKIKGADEKKDKGDKKLSKEERKRAKEERKKQQRETKEKLANMTQEEKLAWAMKEQKEKGGVEMTTESPEVTKEMPGLNSLNEKFAGDRQYYLSCVEKIKQIKEKHNPPHIAIDEQAEKELEACPKEQYSGKPVLQCMRPIKIKAFDRHINLEPGHLKEYQSIWEGFKARIKPHLAEFDARMARVKYGEIVKNPHTKTMLYSIQQSAFATINFLLDITKTQGRAAEYVADKKKFEKDPYGSGSM